MANIYNNIIELTPELGVVSTIPQLVVKILIALILVFLGIFIGKLTKLILRKIIEASEISKIIRYQFINLGLTLVKWSIYLLFFSFALKVLPFPTLTDTLSKFIVVVPALVAALILLLIGFMFAVYLRDLIEDSEIRGYKNLSNYMFFFVIYIFGIYTLKISLVSLDALTAQIIMVLFSVYFGLFLVLEMLRKKR
jgi:hypothetical protein